MATQHHPDTMTDLGDDTEKFGSLAADTRAQHIVPFSYSWHVTKIALRSTSFVACSIFLGLTVTSDVRRSSVSYTYVAWRYNIPRHEWSTFMAFAILGAAWSVAELVTLWVRRVKMRGIHPGIQVVGDLLMTVMAFVALVLLSVRTAAAYRNPFSYAEDLSVDVARLAMASTLFIIHTTLFGRVCKEVHQRMSSRTKLHYGFIPGGGPPFAVRKMTGGHNSSVHHAPPVSSTIPDFATIPPYRMRMTDFDHDDLPEPPTKAIIPGYRP